MKWALLPLFWLACGVAGYIYTQQKGIPWEAARLVAPAFILEATFYLVLGLEEWRTKIEKWPRERVAAILVLAAIAPYLVATLAIGAFSWTHLGAIAVLAAVLAFWYVVLPHNPLS